MITTDEYQNEDNTGILDAKDEGILDLMICKSWAIKLATEAARTVLSVDQIIVARQAGGPKPPGPNPVGSFFLLARSLTNIYRTGMKIRCYIRGAEMYNTTVLDATKSFLMKSLTRHMRLLIVMFVQNSTEIHDPA